MKKSIIFSMLITFSIILTSCFWEENTKIVISTSSTPDYITSIKVKVTADDMETFEKTFSKDATVLEVNIPSGKERFFQVFGYVEEGNVMAVKTFRGTATEDLIAGESVNLDLQMIPFETKILIPDRANNRVVQIDDMNGTNWDTHTGTSDLIIDVDLDSQGRIVFIESPSSAGTFYIQRIDNIKDTSTEIYQTTSDLYSIAIDKVNKIIYIIEIGVLKSIDYDGNTINNSYNIGIISSPSKLSVDSNGLLYIIWHNSSPDEDTISVYNPSTETVLAHKGYGNTSNGIIDVINQNQNIYFAHYTGVTAAIYYIKKLNYNSSKQLLKEVENTTIDQIRSFVTDLSDNNIYYLNSSSNQIISLENLTDINQKKYGSGGPGIGEFNF